MKFFFIHVNTSYSYVSIVTINNDNAVNVQMSTLGNPQCLPQYAALLCDSNTNWVPYRS
jgi:hypothetical protein